MGWMAGIAGEVAAGGALAEGASGLMGAAGEGAAAIGNGAEVITGLDSGLEAATEAAAAESIPTPGELANMSDLAARQNELNAQAVMDTDKSLSMGTNGQKDFGKSFLSSMWDQMNPAKGWNKNDPVASLGKMAGNRIKSSQGEMEQAPGFQEFQASEPTEGQGMIFDAEAELNRLRSRMNQ